MKKIIKKFINILGFDLKRLDPEIKTIDLDKLLKIKLPENPVIFDVGGNRGQSIERFKKIFNNPIIHSFEPIKSEFDYMANRFSRENNIFLNNFALGDKIEDKEFNITAKTATSSFNKITEGTKWLKHRSKQYKTTEKEYVVKIEKVKVTTLDHYCKNKNIQKIDLLKIDTQGYEDKVLEGSLNTIKSNHVGVVLTEIIFDQVYDKHFSFSDIEKYLIPNNFRMVGMDLINNNIFSGLNFFADVLYFSKKHHDI
tara:strand:- start:62 stop:823 length:762 start_codon:yes stop_codon:yes gene_type:complete